MSLKEDINSEQNNWRQKYIIQCANSFVLEHSVRENTEQPIF